MLTAIEWLRRYSVILMLAGFAIPMLLTFWPGRRGRFERDARIPLDSER